jgi:alkanesulfonate monooxygenase SsuD/methylene tetrahydromethanopterin reductase-like flavin-dependent oxidoreductase (luciferase family)
VQKPRPPIWVGGRSDAILEVAARCADGWNTCWVMTPETYRDRLATLASACERHGRDPAELTLSLGLTTLVGESDGDVRARFDRLCDLTPPGVITQPLEEWRTERLVGTVEQVREQVGAWESLGVTTVIAGLGALPFSVTNLDDLELVAAAFD